MPIKYDRDNAIVYLTDALGKPIAQANFSWDKNEATALLSNILGNKNQLIVELQAYLSGPQNDSPMDAVDIVYYESEPSKKAVLVGEESDYASRIMVTDMAAIDARQKIRSEQANKYQQLLLDADQNIDITLFDKLALHSRTQQIHQFLIQHNPHWAVELWGDDFTEEFVRNQVQSANESYALINRNDDSMLAFVRVLTDGQLVYVSNLVVHQALRHNGIATHLLEHITKKYLRDGGFLLLVNGDSAESTNIATNLYNKRFGFTEIANAPQFACFNFCAIKRLAPELASEVQAGLQPTCSPY